ncbi:MAG TPA: hypothetical protein VH109_14095 [Steroidobacteraceae bacterium]|jgi:hypothetical protein|nr:hypothetical protein [Steroidobacteraceae bacterium]
MAGYSGTPLAKKLGLKAGCRLFLESAPANYARLIAPAPPGLKRVARIDEDTDVIHVFSTERRALETQLRSARERMRPDAVVWVSWPKKASGVASDVTEDVVRAVALPMELVDIKVCAVDEVWSGLKLMLRRAARPAAGKSARGGARR